MLFSMSSPLSSGACCGSGTILDSLWSEDLKPSWRVRSLRSDFDNIGVILVVPTVGKDRGRGVGGRLEGS